MNRRIMLKSTLVLGLYSTTYPLLAKGSLISTQCPYSLNLKMVSENLSLKKKLEKLRDKVSYSTADYIPPERELIYKLNFINPSTKEPLENINVTFVNGNSFYSVKGKVPSIHDFVNFQCFRSENDGKAIIRTVVPNSQMKSRKIVNPNYFIVSSSGKASAFILNHLGNESDIVERNCVNICDKAMSVYHQNSNSGYLSLGDKQKSANSNIYNIEIALS